MASKKKEKRSIDIDAPADLSHNEFNAFRLGAVKMLLAVVEDYGIEMPGIYKQAFKNEIIYREHQLSPLHKEQSNHDG